MAIDLMVYINQQQKISGCSFLTKMFHGQWPLMPIVDLWKKRAFSCVLYIYIYQFTCSIIFIYWFIPPFMATCCKVLCKYHITRTWQAVYPVVFILRIGLTWLPQIIHVQTSLIPKKRKPPYPDIKLQSTISIYISSYPHEIYIYIYYKYVYIYVYNYIYIYKYIWSTNVHYIPTILAISCNML